MKQKTAFLTLTILFSLLFICLIGAGSYLLSIQSKQFGVAAFLFAFAAAFGQIGSLAMYIRLVAREKAAYSKLK
ncbi:NGO_0222 family membrane protein [Neisseriaceae bacterium B1]